MDPLDSQLNEVTQWRNQVLGRIKEWLDGLKDIGLAGEAADSEFERVRQASLSDRVAIAFVAEFSRGKSELINALFFSGYGRRVVPSGAGRTTMCPTEFLFEEGQRSGIRLLPIETRSMQTTLLDLKANPALWENQPVNNDDGEDVARQLMRVKETKFVTRAEAEALGLLDQAVAHGDAVEIPRWRHAIVNLPHPLLRQGLTIIDTPGLNALGNEPELTLSVLPSANAVLYVLAADAGVSRSDADVWRDLLATMPRSGRLVVLNKIDGLWDDLRTEEDISGDIYRQAIAVAQTLDVPEGRVFPLSAQKALLARISRNRVLEDRSQVRELEAALADEVLPARRRLIAERLQRFVNDLSGEAGTTLRSRLLAIDEQTEELMTIERNKGDVTASLIKRLSEEKESFQGVFKQLFALRTIVSRQAKSSIELMSPAPIRDMAIRLGVANARSGREFREIFEQISEYVRSKVTQAHMQAKEAHSAVSAVQARMAEEHKLSFPAPKSFSSERYFSEIDEIERAAARAFPSLPIMLPGSRANAQRMVLAASQHLAAVMEKASRELQGWLNTLTMPLDRAMRDQQSQLKRREESLQRMVDARQSLADRLAELQEGHSQAAAQLAELERNQAVIANQLR
ncbi:dynamin family protein [Piscinibacterium candidicorallinum]|uniref:Dynamin family protein n=1 Tax=Piscinibacterium candidicorallinum TaxID=1793872 RepID=A0ABV7HBA9_9BURK